MAWPPPVQPINKTDATPMQGDHAATHNNANQAINDCVTQIGIVSTFANDVNAKVDTLGAKVEAQLRANLLTATGAGGTLTTSESSPTTLTLTTGLWLVGYSLNLHAAATGFGFVDVNIKKAGGTQATTPLQPLMLWDNGVPLRVTGTGLVFIEVTGGSETIHLRAKTFSGSAVYDGSTIAAANLRPTSP